MILTVAAALVPFAVACGGEAAGGGPAAARPPVTGVDWKVDSVTADGTTHHAPATARLRVDEDGGAAGNLGCNHFSARATVHGDRITFGALRTTKMACDRARMAFERALARTLDGRTLTIAAGDGGLTLTAGRDDLVRLTRGAPG
ncbi:META domain-containing protein [Streptomyces sp. TG1A-8]|uniref:META domain-containing protein n=1 Tax=Streptomyces sp. TG1A-8 TaxID=3051385 RepID=UPI00265C72E9|nr:META domain-containing protein [Streptomyces sp. TG1A-8]MDO0927008.1 META domain-containing protein [Streptomyces sp. TG1A-8]